MHPGYVTLLKIYDMYKGNNTKNKSTRPKNAQNGAERNNHPCIFQIIRKMHNIPNVG